MSVVRFIYLWCDVPGCDAEYGPCPNAGGAGAARKEARRSGWVYKAARPHASVIADFCSYHAKAVA